MANMIKVKVNQLKDRLALAGFTMAMANTKGILQSLFCPIPNVVKVEDAADIRRRG